MTRSACMNAIPWGESWARCGWQGEVASLDDPCPRCGNRGRLAPVVEIPKVEEE